jgi:hypothetical protein
MLRRSVLSCALALAATLALAMPALAGGVVVTLDDTPAGVEAGVPFTVGFTVISAHDGSAESGLAPTITFTNPATGETVTAAAKPDGAQGHYIARLMLPSEGEWNWEIQPFGKFAGDFPASVFTPIAVGAPAGQPAKIEPPAQSVPAQQVAPAAPAAQPDTALVPALGAVALVAVAAAIALVRGRRRAAARA